MYVQAPEAPFDQDLGGSPIEMRGWIFGFLGSSRTRPPWRTRRYWFKKANTRTFQHLSRNERCVTQPRCNIKTMTVVIDRVVLWLNKFEWAMHVHVFFFHFDSRILQAVPYGAALVLLQEEDSFVLWHFLLLFNLRRIFCWLILKIEVENYVCSSQSRQHRRVPHYLQFTFRY